MRYIARRNPEAQITVCRIFRETFLFLPCTKNKEPSLLSFEAGFTLFDIFLAILILAVIACIAVPAFYSWLSSYRLRAAANDLYSSFQLAKMTAIERGANCAITFNQIIDSKTYDYVVFVDMDHDLEVDPTDQVMIKRTWNTEKSGVGFDTAKGGGDGLTFASNDEGLPSIAFRPSGIPVSNSGGLGMGSAFLKNKKNHSIKVIVSSAGNIRVSE